MSGYDEDEDAPDLVMIDEPQPLKSLTALRSIPVTLISGYLGSGKTTLLNHILTADHGKRIAVVENEFSSGLGIEGMIAKNGVNGEALEGFFELNNGCICCTVKDDLLITLEQLIRHKDRFDYIIIEATGVANPGPIISSLWTDEDTDSPLRLDGVITVIDASNIQRQLKDIYSTKDARFQIAYADRILLNKVEIVDEATLVEDERLIREINAFVELKKTSFSVIDLDWVLDTHSFSLSSVTPLFGLDKISDNVFCMPCTNIEGSINLKGRSINDHEFLLSSLSLSFDGEFRLDALKSFLIDLLNTKSMDTSHQAPNNMSLAVPDSISILFRMKGVVYMKGYEKLFILQSVHDVFDLQPSEYNAAGPNPISPNRVSVFVVIGHHLNKEDLEKGFSSCFDPFVG